MNMRKTVEDKKEIYTIQDHFVPHLEAGNISGKCLFICGFKNKACKKNVLIEIH